MGKGASDQSTVRITNGGVLTTSAYFDIGSSFTTPVPAGAHGTLLVSGGSIVSNTTTLAQSAWGNQTGDTAIVTFSNSGVGSFNHGLIIGLNGGAATVSLQSLAQLNTATLIGGCTFGPSDGVNITVNNAALNVVGAASLNGGATLNLQSGIASFGGNLSLVSSRIVYSGGSLNVGGSLQMGGSARITLSSGGDKTLRIGTPAVGGGLTIGPGNKLDLSDNTLLLGYTGASPLLLIRSYLITGRAGGAWTGNQLTSSAAAAAVGSAHPTALGIMDDPASDLITVKYTYLGDANLDGKVDIRDLAVFAAHYKASGEVWSSGDFDYNGSVDAKDLGYIAVNWQAGTPGNPGLPLEAALAGFGLPTEVVPEPSSLMLLTSLGMLMRRRRA